jgi:hypothetical protein
MNPEPGQTIYFNVDATNLVENPNICFRKFDIIYFGFPHTGVPNTDEESSILSNHQLIPGYLASLCSVLAPEGFVQLVVGSGHPYDKWDVQKLIAQSPMIF